MNKRIVGLILTGSIVLGSTSIFANNREFIKISIGDQPVKAEQTITTTEEDKVAEWNKTRTCDVVIRVGEYEGKSGKRTYIDARQKADLEKDILVRQDEKGYYVSEFDINLKTATKLYNNLKEQGVKVQLQVAKDKTEDLNAAGRKSNVSNPKLYMFFFLICLHILLLL